MSDPVWNVSFGARLAAGLSIDSEGNVGAAGEVAVTGFGVLLEGDGFDLSLDPQVFVSGNIIPDEYSRTTVGGGVELSIAPDVGSYSPVLRLALGGGASFRHGPGRREVGGAVRGSIGVDVPMLPYSSLSVGLWFSPQVTYVDDAVELTLGLRGTLPWLL